jgi:exonuclease-1
VKSSGSKKEEVGHDRIPPEVAYHIIKVLKRMNIEFYVAPYEASAQITYLWKQGLVHAVITERSTLLAYGCQRVFLKMDDKGDGMCIILYFSYVYSVIHE